MSERIVGVGAATLRRRASDEQPPDCIAFARPNGEGRDVGKQPRGRVAGWLATVCRRSSSTPSTTSCSSSSSSAHSDDKQTNRTCRWLVGGALGVLVLGVAITVGHLSDERDQAKAEAARAQAALDRERIDVGRGAQPPALLGHSGALFSLPSSPSLTEGAIGVVITNAIAGRNYTWIVVDGRGAVPGDGYFLEGGLCDSGSAVPFGGGPGSLAGGASNTDGDLRLVAGPLLVAINDSDLWAQLRHDGEDLGGIRGPLIHPTWVPPGTNPCHLPSEAGS